MEEESWPAASMEGPQHPAGWPTCPEAWTGSVLQEETEQKRKRERRESQEKTQMDADEQAMADDPTERMKAIRSKMSLGKKISDRTHQINGRETEEDRGG